MGGEQMEQLCEDFRSKLAQMDQSLEQLQTKVSEAERAEVQMRDHAQEVAQRIQQNQARATSAQAEMKSWIERPGESTREKIAEWKARQETSKLEDRASEAESYAAAAIETASAALDEAEHAAFNAWLARHDVETAKAKQTNAHDR
jgi:chromosome segregation ATPase